MSKVSFRARALDSNKPLPLYFEEELPDLSEYVAINRTVPQMPTGMEKEEESESHLQKVMNARQNLKDTSNLVIPIPEADIPVLDYSNVYEKIRSQSHNYVRMPGLGPDEELPDYDLDSEDEEWLSVQSRERPLSPIHFERMMDRLEKGSGNTVLSDRDAQLLLKDNEELVMAVYDYWLAKRLRLGRPLVPSVKNERREGTSSSNPYLAFRKRTEKMQTRKNRKNDEQAYMHMLKLKRDLTRSITLIELVKEREQRKYDCALIQAEIFRKRYLLQDWSGSLISSLKPHGASTSNNTRRLSTPDNKWDNKGIIMKGDYFDDGDAIIPLSTKRRKRRKGPMYTPTMLDHESPLATIGLSKSDKELKEAEKIDANEERIDVEELDGPFTFKRKIHLHYHKSKPFDSWPWDVSSTSVEDTEHGISQMRKRHRYSRTTLNGRHLGFSRRRVGRGGRCVWDYVPESDMQYGDETFDNSQMSRTMEEEDLGTAPSTPSHNEPETQSRCPHFYPASPKSTSFIDFEFTYLPFVDPSSYPCPELNKGYSQFAGQTLNDEEEGASSFSSLPTSQFTLRPSFVQLDQNNDHVQVQSHSSSPPREQSATASHHGDEFVWKKFQQSHNTKATTTALTGETSNTATVVGGTSHSAPNVPSTHLSSLESSLPIQIHVDNLTHLPKKDTKIANPNTFTEQHKTTAAPCPSHQSQPSPLPTVPSSSLSTDHTSDTSAVQTPAQPNKELLVWFKDCPSSNMLSLNNNAKKRSASNRFRCSLPSTIARSVTARFKTEVKPETQPIPLQPLSSIVPSISLPNVSPSSPLTPHPLLPNQHQIVSSLMSDPKKLESFVRDKRHFAATAHPIASNHQNSSPNNGTAALELNHKLSTDTDRDIKHTLAARTMVNNHSLVDGSSSNVLVKLASSTPPSEVT